MRAPSTLSVISFALLIASSTLADPSTRSRQVGPSLREESLEAKAKERFKAGQAAYDLGQFEKALQLYSEAYAAMPLPAFLFNIAQCHKQLGHWERAGFFYRRFSALAPEGTDQDKLQSLIAQMDQKVAEEQQRKDAELQRKERERDAAALRAHTLELEKARAATANAEAQAAQERAAEAAAAAKAASARPPEVPLYQRWWVWAGGGAVIAVAASVTAVAVATRPHAAPATFGTVNAR
jgi:tetratricopeptide (TPR) repeat protein